MNRPTHIKVGVHDFKIVWDAKVVLEEMQRTHTDRYAHTDFDKLECCMDDRMVITRQREVLLHEILHMIYWAYAIFVPVEMTEQEKKYSYPNEEEKLIQQTTVPLLLVLWDNPDIVEWLTQKDPNHADH